MTCKIQCFIVKLPNGQNNIVILVSVPMHLRLYIKHINYDTDDLHTAIPCTHYAMVNVLAHFMMMYQHSRMTLMVLAICHRIECCDCSLGMT